MTDTLTAEKLEEIEARAEAATLGPIEALYVSEGAPSDVCNFGIVSRSTGRETARVWSRDDVEFYAAAHTDIPALLAHAKAQAAEIERLTKERDIAVGERVARSKLMKRLRNSLINIRDGIEDEVDRAYFGSSNDADEFRDVVGRLEDWNWHDILRDEQLSDPFETSRKAVMRAEEGEARATAAEAKVVELEKLLNAPEVFDFVKAVQLEAAHQRARWGSDHDAGKTDADWFWLVGYLAGKALHNPPNDMPPAEAQLHRIVAAAAALANWHAAKLGLTNMRPGIEPPLDAALGAKP